MKYVPRSFQARAARFIIEHKRCALHMDVGTGKTATTLAACKELLESLDIRGVMVFAPLRVMSIAWPEELLKWDDFSNLTRVIVLGDVTERIAKLRSNANLYLLNYDLMPWWIEWAATEFRSNKLKQDMLVLDESSRLKSAGSTRFKMLKPLADSPLFPRIVELTGTPAPESYEDLWSQYRLLDKGAALEPYVTHFRVKYFDQNPWNKYDWKLKRGAEAEIQKRIAPMTVTIRAEEYLNLPPVLDNVMLVDLPALAMKKYKQVEKDMLLALGNETIVASSAAIVSEKCRQVIAGAVYDEKKVAHKLHEVKFDALDELIENGSGNLLVSYWYRHEAETVRKRYPKAEILGPDNSTSDTLRIVRAWNEGKIPLLFMQPASIGHGINLQAGGHHLVWLTIPWSNELYRQTVGRLHRMGQEKPVTVTRILARGTIDVLDGPARAVDGKEFSQQELRKALSALSKQTLDNEV